MIVDNSRTAKKILRVAVDVPLRTALDYLPPPGRPAESLPVGARVRVPVGRRLAVGVIIGHAIDSELAAAQLRPVRELLDDEPLLDPTLLQLLEWAAEYYHHPIGEVIAAALPRALRTGSALRPQAQFWRASPAGIEAHARGEPRRAPRQRALLALLVAAPSALHADDLTAALADWRAAARALNARGWLQTTVGNWLGSPSADSGPHVRADAATATAAAAQLPPALTPEQSVAVQRIDAAAGGFTSFVLLGVTGSGKTEVYLQCAARTLARGRSVLVLVPEIGLTPQLVERFRARFMVPLAVLHSGLTDNQRLAAWLDARSGRARIVLGTRSAIFAPLRELGLIVVDEEHDSSYKQHEGGCRYSARDLAVMRAQQAAAPIVLGSATPAFETLQNLNAERYHPLHLPRRAGQAPPPRLALVDLRTQAMRAGICTAAVQAIGVHLAARGQVLVFINRRGYAPTLLCTGCGWIAPCHQCDARLNVHRIAGRLRCHHCGADEPLPAHCPRCGYAVKPVGQGTERIEETLRELFPDEPLARLDRDTARRPEDLQAVMQAVHSGQARILVGTQMVTKGHHFPEVTLVVVLNADQGLFSTDFRAAERLAQTIVQVAGRAGREARQGEVLIQTEYPEHPLLQSLLTDGYLGFAETALAERRAARWPPFGRLALLRASSTTPQAVMDFLSSARQCAPASPEVRLLGPVAAAMARRAGRYHAQLLLEADERGALQRFLAGWLPQVDRLPHAGRARWALDVDPIDIQ